MAKRIVVGLDPSKFSKNALDIAVQRAALQDATVIGVAVADLPGIERAESAAPPGAMHYAQKAIDSHLAKAQDTCEKLLDEFEETCKKAGVKCEKEYHTGRPSKVLVEMGYSADIAMMGIRTFFHFETQEDPGDTLRKFLEARPCPVVAVPETVVWPPKKIIIPYDPSPESARALRSFTLLTQQFPLQKDVMLLRVDDSIDEGMRCIKRQVKYLEAWGYNVETEVVPGDPKKVILETALANSPSMVVLVAYNHNPIAEMFFGSATMALINNGTIPLFIAA